MVLNWVFKQPSTMHPRARQDITYQNVKHLFPDEPFNHLCARRLAESVKLETITYDGMGLVGDDSRWDVFYRFSELLQETFPRV